MSGRSHGSDYSLHIFTEDGPAKVVNANDHSVKPNIESKRIERNGSTESEPETQHNGWQIQLTFDRESFVLDDLIDRQQNTYHNGEPQPEMEIVGTKAVPALGGATRTYRYVNATISDWQDQAQGQNESAEISVTFETGKRVEV